MAGPEIYRDELYGLNFGHALWEPDPAGEYSSVEVGDVGFVRKGFFTRLFNILLPANHESQGSVPDDFRPLDYTGVNKRDHKIHYGVLTQKLFRSHSVFRVSAEGKLDSSPIPIDGEILLKCSRERGAALAIHDDASREDTNRLGFFTTYLCKNWESWVSFSKSQGFGIEPKDIILVTGRDLARSWAVVAFAEGHVEAKLALGAKATVVSGSSALSVFWTGGSHLYQNHGPALRRSRRSRRPAPRMTENEIDRDREDQCIFIRGFTAKKRMFPKREVVPKILKAAAEPRDDWEPDDEDPFPGVSTSGCLNSNDGTTSSSGSDSDVGPCRKSKDIVLETLTDAPAPDPTSAILDYILENSTADLAIVHSSQLHPFLDAEIDQVSVFDSVRSALSRVRPPIVLHDGAASIELGEIFSNHSTQGTISMPPSFDHKAAIERLTPFSVAKVIDESVHDQSSPHRSSSSSPGGHTKEGRSSLASQSDLPEKTTESAVADLDQYTEEAATDSSHIKDTGAATKEVKPGRLDSNFSPGANTKNTMPRISRATGNDDQYMPGLFARSKSIHKQKSSPAPEAARAVPRQLPRHRLKSMYQADAQGLVRPRPAQDEQPKVIIQELHIEMTWVKRFFAIAALLLVITRIKDLGEIIGTFIAVTVSHIDPLRYWWWAGLLWLKLRRLAPHPDATFSEHAHAESLGTTRNQEPMGSTRAVEMINARIAELEGLEMEYWDKHYPNQDTESDRTLVNLEDEVQGQPRDAMSESMLSASIALRELRRERAALIDQREKHYLRNYGIDDFPSQTRHDGARFHVVLIGIDSYTMFRSPLRGSVNDAKLMQELCTEAWGVPKEQITLLTSDNPDTTQQPTRENILTALYALRDNRGITEGDSIIFYFSGYGTKYDAWDKGIKAICPMDRGCGDANSPVLDISDRELNIIISEICTKTGGHANIIIDACHSARGVSCALDAEEGRRYMDPLRPSLGNLLVSADTDPRRRAYSQRASSTTWVADRSACIYTMAACQPYEPAFERELMPGRFHGLFTYQLVRLLKSDTGDMTYADLEKKLNNSPLIDHPEIPLGLQTAYFTGEKGRKLWSMED